MKQFSAGLAAIVLIATGISPTHGQSVSSKQESDLLKLVGTNSGPRSFSFCDADKSTRQCKGNKGLRAGGLGGAFIPLALEVRGFKITRRTSNGRTAQINSKFDTAVNGIAPKCRDAEATVSASSGVLEFKGFYCNWLAIGNVLARVTLDVDRVNTKTKTFSGNYTLRLVGTGNMFGRGYFVAKAR